MQIFLIVLTICAIVFAVYEGVMLIIFIRKKIAEKRAKQKEKKDEKLSGDSTARKDD